MFYLSWKSQVDILNDKELRRFINNLIQYHDGGDIELKSKTDKLVWNGILPALEVNDLKYQSKVEASRENGKKGGRPPKEKISQETQQVFDKPKEPDNSKGKIVNSEKEIDNGKRGIDNSEKKIENGKLENENGKENVNSIGRSSSSYLKEKIENLEDQLILEFNQYPFLLTMANPSGIKELKYHVDPEDLEELIPILDELAVTKLKVYGRYD